MPKNRQKQEQKLRESLERCLILPESEKAFWIQNLQQLPDSLLANVFEAVESKNLIMDSYQREALKHDPDHKLLAKLEEKIKQIKKGSLQLEEKSQNLDADEDLQKSLKNV